MKNIKQSIFCAAGGKMEQWARANGFTVFSFKKSFSLNPIIAYKLARFASKNNVSHVHTHDSHSHSFAVIAASFFSMKKPLIVHRRVDFPLKRNALTLWKYNHPQIKKIICVSEFISQLIRPDIRRPQLIRTIHSGIDLEAEALFSGTNLREEFQIPASHFVIINLAAIAPHKDYFTFVNTVQILVEKGLPATFLIVGGDGGERSKIEKYIGSKGLEKHIRLTGFRSDVNDILNQTDLMLFTSKTEGLGGAVLDAMKAGVPVVATATGGVPEIIEEGISGLLVNVGDANGLAQKVIDMLHDENLKQRISINGKEKTLEFSKKITAQKTLELYLSVSSSA